jgi:hypothetical protein
VVHGYHPSQWPDRLRRFGDAVSARITNTSSQSLSGLFTLTIFGADGSRIGQTQGSASDVGPGEAAAVTFIGMTDQLPGDPSSYTYEFQDNGSY